MSAETAAPLDPAAVARDVLDYWFAPAGHGEHGRRRDHWFAGGPAVDEEIRRRFGPAYEAAAAGQLDELTGSPRGTLALVILFDQFSRNMFRDDGRAFQTDARARQLAGAAIASGGDTALSYYERLFLYMPFMHGEDIAIQKRALELFGSLVDGSPDGDGDMTMRQAQRHHDEIARFGRFPYRNAALGRQTTAEEAQYLKELEEQRARWRAEQAARRNASGSSAS
ncbi:MAG: DUF924 family protein [Alphaproteobacteria bacterium]